MNSTDVFVVGGGPAGLAMAIAARQRGFRVVVADGQQPPIDKACGEGLMPDGLAALERLGVSVEDRDSASVPRDSFSECRTRRGSDVSEWGLWKRYTADRIASVDSRASRESGN